MEDIKAGSIVRLTFDSNKRFLVENDALIGGKNSGSIFQRNSR